MIEKRRGRKTSVTWRRHQAATESQSVTRGQQICVRILVFLIIIGILTGVVFRIGIGRKLGRDLAKGEALCSEGKFEDALQVVDEIREKYPRFRKRAVVYLRGLCLSRLGHVEEAKVLWKRVIGSRADRKYYPASLYHLAHFLEVEGQYDKAIGDYEKILSRYKDSEIVPEVLVSLADCYQKKKKWIHAKKKYEEVLLSYGESLAVSRAKEKLGDLNIRIIFSPYATEDDITYEVKSGDTLEEIADDFNTTAALIRKANRLGRRILAFGKRLKITPGNFEIYVDADENFLTLNLNGKFFKEYRVGTGKFGCTPTGNFKIVNKQVKPVWYSEEGIFPYGHRKNILGTRWMGFDKTGYGLHGTTEPDTIGKHSSAGCIRLLNKDVEELFMLVSVGTPVIITGTIVPAEMEEILL